MSSLITETVDDRMGHEAEIIIPGSFVALQGTPGDGMINTLETPWHPSDAMMMMEEEIVLPPSHEMTRQVTEDSFVVVVTDHEEESPKEEYHRQCLQQATSTRNEWKDSAKAMATEHLFWTNDFWWLQKGKVAVLRELPTKLMNGTILRSVIGTVTPGTTIVATDICYLDSKTLQRLQVPPITSSGGSTLPHRIYPRGKQGWLVLVKLQLHGRMGYATLSVDGYPLLAPGLPSWYTDPNCWIWRVTCPAGAFVREGLDLNTHHIDTIPFGSLVRVTRRTINSQGLSRLRVSAMVDDQADSRLVDGWCSEFLNPLSGNRGSVLTPLAFPLPPRYRVIIPAGAVVRAKVELSTPSIMELPLGTIVAIKARAFSEHPVERCLDRLQLMTGGWISVRLNRPPPQDPMVVEFVEIDHTFDPEIPHLYQHSHPDEDLRELSSVDSQAVSVEQPLLQPYAQCVICLTQERNATIVHGETGHVACCLVCARILKARGDKCPVCRLPIDLVIQQFWA